MEEQSVSFIGRLRHRAWVAGMFIAYLFDRALLWAGVRAKVIAKESDLFLGTALFLIGLLGFESARYCDGNSADYLSCTRPATYYFYDAPHTILIVLGVVLILTWWVRKNER